MIITARKSAAKVANTRPSRWTAPFSNDGSSCASRLSFLGLDDKSLTDDSARDEFEVIKTADEAFATVAHYRIKEAHTEEKDEGEELSDDLKRELVERFRTVPVVVENVGALDWSSTRDMEMPVEADLTPGMHGLRLCCFISLTLFVSFSFARTMAYLFRYCFRAKLRNAADKQRACIGDTVLLAKGRRLVSQTLLFKVS